MVRILCLSLLSLALSVGALTAGDKDKISPHQLENLANEASKLKGGASSVITLKIGEKEVAYTVTKDALGNITATGPADAEIQTIAIATGSSGTQSSVPLAATIITKEGNITSYNLSTSKTGEIIGVSSSNDTVVVKTGPNLTTTTTVTQTTSSGLTISDTFTSSGGSGGGTVTVTYAPGTSPTSTTSVSPH